MWPEEYSSIWGWIGIRLSKTAGVEHDIAVCRFHEMTDSPSKEKKQKCA